MARMMTLAELYARIATRPALPCFPCPHSSSCCAYGTKLTEAEAAAIVASHGHGFVYQTQWGEWRTRVRKKRCILYRDGGCSVHDQPYYPTTCRGFPWTDGISNQPYEFDVTICGELAQTDRNHG